MATDEAEFSKRLLATFRIEADEHLTSISNGLLKLEKTGSPAEHKKTVEIIFREAHSLKGAARAVNMEEIESVCRSLETVFSSLKAKAMIPDREDFDVLHDAVNYMKSVLSLESGSSELSGQGTALLEKLEGFAGKKHEEQKRIAGDEKDTSSTDVFPANSVPPATDPEREDTIRISVSRLDSLHRQMEEMLSFPLKLKQHADDLVKIRASLVKRKKTYGNMQIMGHNGYNHGLTGEPDHGVDCLIKNIRRDQRLVATMIRNLLSDIRKTLMFPFASMLETFPKMVRDLTRDQGKMADLEMSGTDTEVDRRILEGIKDPLIHLLRNCSDHGIEPPEERIRMQKPESGKITLAISQLPGNKVKITVADDGRGIDNETVRKTAVRLGLIGEKELESITPQKIESLLFQSGVSTAPMITDISGRGLGLAIVKEKVDGLGGSLSLESEPGAGTSVHIILPMLLATFRGIFVSVSGQQYVIPVINVVASLRIRQNELKSVENKLVIPYQEGTLSFCFLSDVLETRRADEKKGSDEFIQILVLESGYERIAFGVDEVLYEQEVLVKEIGNILKKVRNIDGATITGSGKVIPVLHVNDLVRSAVQGSKTMTGPAVETGGKEAGPKSVVVAEDSITARMLLKDILESAGYLVKTAVDGAEALSFLREGDFDILVSDVEMPRMNGFDLTAKVRADPKLKELPVILVTALQTRADREKGLEAGANAYIEKGKFDPVNLLGILGKMV
ncbi:MAG: response regulator [Bacteroidota bacterium]